MDADFLIHRVACFTVAANIVAVVAAQFGEVRFGDVNVNLRNETALEELF